MEGMFWCAKIALKGRPHQCCHGRWQSLKLDHIATVAPVTSEYEPHFKGIPNVFPASTSTYRPRTLRTFWFEKAPTSSHLFGLLKARSSLLSLLNHKSLFLRVRPVFICRVLLPRNGSWKHFSIEKRTHVVLCSPERWENEKRNFSSTKKAEKADEGKESKRNLYSGIVFISAIIISNGYVCVPYTSARLHLFDLPPFLLLRMCTVGGNIGLFYQMINYTLLHTRNELFIFAPSLLPYLLTMTVGKGTAEGIICRGCVLVASLCTGIVRASSPCR